jgi:hypothetical protein
MQRSVPSRKRARLPHALNQESHRTTEAWEPVSRPGPPSERTRASCPRRALETFPPCEALEATAPLTASTLARLRAAMYAGTPLLLRLRLSESERTELLDGWAAHVRIHSTERHQTVGLAAEKLPLGVVWKTAQRIESGLAGETDNPVLEWLASPSRRGTARSRMRQVQAQLETLASRRCAELSAQKETKAFVAGRIKPGGGPTHYDAYDNFALVLTGSKVFYHAPAEAFKAVEQCGEKWERLSVNPFDELASNPIGRLDTQDSRGVALAPWWRAAAMEAGDVFFLPHRWWHWVWSEPHTVMTNEWVDRHER